MGAKQEDANLILKLYELRREPVMRQARAWFGGEFHPTSANDILNVMKGEHSAYYRMVTSYWDMACALVNHGAIDAALFRETNGEHMYIFAKIEPYLAELRQMYGNPHLIEHLERCVRETPDSERILKALRERQAAMRNAARAR